MSVRKLIFGSVFLTLIAHAEARDSEPGVVEGHLKIVSLPEVDLQKSGTPEKARATPYADYPLVIRRKGENKEVARITADGDGNFRTELPAGDYVLDVAGRKRKHARATPRAFTVFSYQTVHVDLAIDTGIR